MENMFILKKTARSIALASVIVFSAAGVAHAAGAGDQTGQHGDMSGHGGPIDKKAGSGGGQSTTGQGAPAPEPRGYQQSGGSTSGQGTSGQGQGGSSYRGGSSGQGAGSSGQGSGSQGGGHPGNLAAVATNPELNGPRAAAGHKILEVA